MFGLICICFSSFASKAYQYKIKQPISYDNVYTVMLKNRIGNIEFEACKEEKINIKLVKIINCSDERIAKDFAQKVKLKNKKHDDTLSIGAILPEKRAETIESVHLNYKIKVPKDIALKIQNGNGNVIIKGIYGNQKIEVANGDVELVDTIGKFDLKINKGSISGLILLNGESEFHTDQGDISIKIWDTVFYPTTAETDNGSITFSLPVDFSAKLKASAPNGTFSCDLPASITQEANSGTIEGRINNGRTLLRLKASNGNININKMQKGKKEKRKRGENAERAEREKTEEQDIGNIELEPILDFNRVQGFVLGGAAQASTVQAGGGRIYGSLEYGWANGIWNYQLGAEKSWLDKHKIAIGAGIYKITDTNEAGLLSESEDLLSTVLFGEAFSDYFLREGYKSWLALKLTPSTKFRVQYNNDEYSSLVKKTNWSLLNPEEPKPFNRIIDNGILKSTTFSYLFDTRDVKKHSQRDDFSSYPVPCQDTETGWLGNVSMEYAGEYLGGNFDYTIYQFNIARYNRISGDHAFDFRIKVGLSTEKLPRQKLFYLGGIGNLRGYELKEFPGDNMVLINLEYSLKIYRHLWSSIFLDSGYTWLYKQEANFSDLHSSAGFGIRVGIEDESIIAYLAQPLERNRGPGLILRLERMF